MTPEPDREAGEFLPSRRFTPVQLLILLMGFVVAMIDGFDILVMAYTAPAITQEWGVAPRQMGLIFSAGLLGMTLGSMFLGTCADLYGRRTTISVSLIVAGAATYATQHATGAEQLAVLRFVSGLGLGTLLSALPTLAREYSPARHRNVTVAILLAGASVGGVLGGLMAASLITEFGWRAIFAWAGIVTVVSGVLFQLLVRESLPFIAARSPADALERINKILHYLGHPRLQQLPALQQAARESASVKSLLTPARRANTLLAWGAFFFSYATIYFMSSWLPKMLVDSGLTQQQGIRGTVVLTAGAIVGTIAVGALSRRWRLTALIAASFAAGTALMIGFSLFVGGAHGKDPTLLWALIFTIGMVISGAFSNLYSVSLMLYPPQVRSTGLGWCIGLGRGGAVLGPMLAGVLIGAGMSAPDMLRYFAIPTLLAAVAICFIKTREPAA